MKSPLEAALCSQKNYIKNIRGKVLKAGEDAFGNEQFKLKVHRTNTHYILATQEGLARFINCGTDWESATKDPRQSPQQDYLNYGVEAISLIYEQGIARQARRLPASFYKDLSDQGRVGIEIDKLEDGEVILLPTIQKLHEQEGKVFSGKIKLYNNGVIRHEPPLDSSKYFGKVRKAVDELLRA